MHDSTTHNIQTEEINAAAQIFAPTAKNRRRRTGMCKCSVKQDAVSHPEYIDPA